MLNILRHFETEPASVPCPHLASPTITPLDDETRKSNLRFCRIDLLEKTVIRASKRMQKLELEAQHRIKFPHVDKLIRTLYLQQSNSQF